MNLPLVHHAETIVAILIVIVGGPIWDIFGNVGEDVKAIIKSIVLSHVR